MYVDTGNMDEDISVLAVTLKNRHSTNEKI